ncbi:DUF3943 domain-containing protein [Helicobacter sp. MIT 21-1697]|uniref:DUF3943 domain-containing protein n=1 Tax=Helicobacter sp. MIT 21-1697 TaxID=2993733 RepID=UPI00224A8921|nr:DUF3943 domain-containing protein [Helicobacter sp. MIT 21-1697]MCX2716681.1 DUF3943 domain-containing protein [Helicobacter sp. MIT 21-1697]
MNFTFGSNFKFILLNICLVCNSWSTQIPPLEYDKLESYTESNTLLDSQQYQYYEPQNKFAYLATSSGIILGGTLISAGVLYLMPESVTNWNKDEINNLGKNWTRKISQGPVVDADDWFLNWVTHPYWGAVYYMQPRVAGYSWNVSALYSVLASALFWEYGVEAFAEIPSWQDLIVTPAIGSMFGELFYQTSLHIHNNHDTILGSRFLGKSVLLLMDPVGFILKDLGLAKAIGIKNKNETQSFIMPLKDMRGGAQIVFAMRF